MTWPTVVFVIVLALLAGAVVCLILIACFWRSVGRGVNDALAKGIAKSVQMIAGLASLRAAFEAGAQKEEWWNACIAGVLCILLWEIVTIVVDSRVKAVDKLDKFELGRAKRESESRTKLLTLLRKLVSEKGRRVRREALRRAQRLQVSTVRNALTPDPHLDELLEALAIFFQQQLPAERGYQHNFRVGVYLNRDGVMTPVHAVSLNNPGYNPFSSYQANQDRFRLAISENSSHVVRSVREQNTIIVEDCPTAETTGAFAFFSQPQRTYLQSMVAHYLGEVCAENGTMTATVLVLDTDATGFFREADRESVTFVLREFGARIRLELDLISLLTPRG